MLHKRLVFVSLLAPSLSFASTAADSLAGSTSDVFDNLTENPAFVNAEGGKSYLRISKAGAVQAITSAGGYGLGIQVNTAGSALVAPLAGNAKEITDAAKTLSAAGLPLSLTLGGTSGDTKWGATLQYENSKIDGASAATTFDPSFMKSGLNLGVVMGATEASLSLVRDSWKVATSGKTKTLAAETTTNLPDGMSEQSKDAMGVVVRHTIGKYQYFVALNQSKTKAKFWSSASSTTSSQDELNKSMGFDLGAMREDKLADGMMLFSKSWIGWSKSTDNASQAKKETTDLALSSAHGVEVAAASWATLRAGVAVSVYGNNKTTATTYADANQGGASAANSTTSSFVLRAITAPTMGVGFKFGNYTIDATLAQDGTGDLGFSDKVLGKVEVTGQF